MSAIPPTTTEVPGSNPRPYRFNRKRGFFTYPNADALTKEKIMGFYLNIDPRIKYCIAEELHANGKKHFHCAIEFSKKLDKKNARWNDIEGHHCNDAGGVRDWSDVVNYCAKDGNYIFFGLDPSVDQDPFGEAIKRAKTGDVKRAFEHLCKENPKEVVLRGEQIKRNLSMLAPINNQLVTEKKIKPLAFKENEVIEKWFLDHVYPDEMSFDDCGGVVKDRFPCLFIIGPTKLGKTSYIQSHGKHLFYRNNFSLEHWSDDVDYLVFDDCEWDFVIPANKKTILLGQGYCVATDKYLRKMAINANKPCVWIANDDPVFKTDSEHQYWLDNGVWVYIKDKMYEENVYSQQI